MKTSGKVVPKKDITVQCQNTTEVLEKNAEVHNNIFFI